MQTFDLGKSHCKFHAPLVLYNIIHRFLVGKEDRIADQRQRCSVYPDSPVLVLWEFPGGHIYTRGTALVPYISVPVVGYRHDLGGKTIPVHHFFFEKN
ncbi:MAG: hypothetical protein BWX93_00965 [Bacteroidetes bacterium ADurb.Bin139]|nr:MAG: hypothetical protein BWX93_00965 [Bacteroidetes bacterium ADurb.Bin139]